MGRALSAFKLNKQRNEMGQKKEKEDFCLFFVPFSSSFPFAWKGFNPGSQEQVRLAKFASGSKYFISS
jgi:hypothetical protein